MLQIKVPVKYGDVTTIKLTSGEELIGKLDKDDDTHVYISKPMVLTMGAKGIGMTPYLFTVNPDTVVPIYRTAIAVFMASDKEMADSYLSGTSGIIL